MALTLKDIALAFARANGHPEPEAYADEVTAAHAEKDVYVHPSKRVDPEPAPEEKQP